MSVVRVVSLCAPVVGLWVLSGCNASNSGGLLPAMSGQRVPPPATGSYRSSDPYYQGPAQVSNAAADSTRLASADPPTADSSRSADAAITPAGESSAVQPAAYATAPAPRIPASAMPPAGAPREPSTPLRLRMRGMEPIDLSPPPASAASSSAPRQQQAEVGQGQPEKSLRTASASPSESLPWRAPGR